VRAKESQVDTSPVKPCSATTAGPLPVRSTFKDSPFRAEQGKLLLFALQGTKATRVAEAPTGKNAQGVTFTPDGKYILVQNYVEKELAACRLTGSGLKDTGVRVKVGGHPASIRVAPR
ncbi:MAG: hypothetical protein HYU24_15875, partial [Candidatus Rokubacteria bacterium]|nr:hypothetical protein [Candidatus Rokubacteria bacterium]